MKLIQLIGKIFLGLALSLIFFLLLLYKNDIPSESLIEKYSTAESHFIDVDGVNLHVRIKGKGEPIFLIHGSFSSLHTWEAWQAELSPYFLTISLDLPGHGLTGPDELMRYGMDDYSQLVLRLAEKLNLSRFHLAGNGMGGEVALHVASNRPDQVLTLNLINPTGVPEPKPRQFEDQTKSSNKWERRILKHPLFTNLLLKCTPKFLFAMNLEKLYMDETKISKQVLNRYFELMLRTGNREAAVDRLLQDDDNIVDFSRLDMPTLIMWGSKDPNYSGDLGRLFQKEIPSSHLVVYEDSGRFPMEETPTSSVAEYLSFLGVEVRKDYLQEPKFITDAD
ncbi:alpha/beta hydrolase [Algoriphagus sp. CAU 1675]|uniref:alpha/beta fold hydrolase n=1 Tax=Algoriphagus sp. CAU 1675 TaxID=3032597 RepID=UPI0023DCA942|nr:alpha/beta hydrolase [Algoriphagus sp. CAU 1675]MDF2158089.1 alpha/beta hydrolase [Algoriphagus sp. CAU 1675]